MSFTNEEISRGKKNSFLIGMKYKRIIPDFFKRRLLPDSSAQCRGVLSMPCQVLFSSFSGRNESWWQSCWLAVKHRPAGVREIYELKEPCML